MNDRMKGMSLGSFSGIKKTQPKTTPPAKPEPEPAAEEEKLAAPNPPKEEKISEQKNQDKPEAKPEPQTETEPQAKSKTKQTTAKPETTNKAKAKVGRKTQAKEELVTVNIKIRKDQKTWLTDTASTVRNNNSEPVAPSERVYPQHLIGVAIDFLQAAGVDWGEVRNVEELREHLNL